jgi:shikimate kinase
MSMDHLFFCGIKHSGKSTLGRLYAKANTCWIDLVI